MKILVTGGSGLLGKKFIRLLKQAYQVVGTYNSKPDPNLIPLDLSQEQAIVDCLTQIKPDLVIHTAAMTDVKQCEESKYQSFHINTLGTIMLAKRCDDMGIKMIYFSSDYVFSGNHSPYCEKDEANPINFYGECKRNAEKIILAIFKNTIIIRPSIMYGFNDFDDKLTFPIHVLNYLKKNQKLKVDNSRIKYPILIDDIVYNTMKLINNNRCQIFHFCSQEGITRYEWALKIAKIFGYSRDLIEGSESEQNKPYNIQLLNSSDIELSFRTCESGLRFIQEQINENS